MIILFLVKTFILIYSFFNENNQTTVFTQHVKDLRFGIAELSKDKRKFYHLLKNQKNLYQTMQLSGYIFLTINSKNILKHKVSRRDEFEIIT